MNKQNLLDCWKMFRHEHEVSADRIVCDPLLRRQFLDSVAPIIPDANEFEILWTLLTMRKQKKLTK